MHRSAVAAPAVALLAFLFAAVALPPLPSSMSDVLATPAPAATPLAAARTPAVGPGVGAAPAGRLGPRARD